MKKFKFVEPFKVEIQYPNIHSVYREEGDDEDGGKDFFSFEDGVRVDNETVQNWVNECVQDLLDNPEYQYSYRHSGNTLVIATKNQEEIHVFVSKSHMESTIPLYEYTYGEEETV
jgi:hypothetical protein